MSKFMFTAGPWNIHEGNETFGPGHRKTVGLEEKMKKFAEIGMSGMQFHDDDAVPDMDNMTDKQIIDYAKVPTNPSTPNVTRNTTLGAVLGAVLAAMVLTVVMLLDQRIKSDADLQRVCEAPILGYIPDMAEEAAHQEKKVRR